MFPKAVLLARTIQLRKVLASCLTWMQSQLLGFYCSAGKIDLCIVTATPIPFFLPEPPAGAEKKTAGDLLADRISMYLFRRQQARYKLLPVPQQQPDAPQQQPDAPHQQLDAPQQQPDALQQQPDAPQQQPDAPHQQSDTPPQQSDDTWIGVGYQDLGEENVQWHYVPIEEQQQGETGQQRVQENMSHAVRSWLASLLVRQKLSSHSDFLTFDMR